MFHYVQMNDKIELVILESLMLEIFVALEITISLNCASGKSPDTT